ncbi:MAG: Gfo/Idh/MocA family oxidoreductase [Bacteroidales bacterium]
MKIYNWGILGAGKMSAKFTKGLKLLENARLYSVGSQDIERARKFASDNGYEKSYGSYEEFASDPGLDIVYIATPHSSHYENVLLCLKYGKAVLCEKAFSLNAREVKDMIRLANEKKIFLMEALWPPFQPFYRKANEIISSGLLGRIIHMDAWFSFQPPFDPADRKFNISLGGGSLLDIGIYPVIDALTFMGIPDEVSAKAAFSPTGSEKTICALFRYNDGRLASIYSSFETSSGIGSRLHCEYGNMTVMRGRDMNQTTILELNGQEPQVFTYSPEAMGYDREAREVMRCLDEGLTESPVVPHSFSAGLMETLDRIRIEAGIVFPGRD